MQSIDSVWLEQNMTPRVLTYFMGLDFAAYVFYFVTLGLMVAQRNQFVRAAKTTTETPRIAVLNNWTIPPWSKLHINGKLNLYLK